MPAGIKRVLGGVQFMQPPVFTAASLAALGSSQATAAPLSATVTNVTGADGTKGVRLPASPRPGAFFAVYNATATNGLPVYPGNGAAINGGTLNAAVSIEGKTLALFIATDAANWAAIYTANV